MELKGKVLVVGNTEQVTDKFKKRSVIIETKDQYPQTIEVEFVQDNCDKVNGINIGDEVTVGINIRGRKWTNKEGVDKYFTSVQGWYIKAGGTQTEMPADDGLPF